MDRRLRQVLAQPVPALRQRLRLGVHPADLAPLAAAEQVMVDPQPDLGADLDARQADEHVQGVGDPAVGRVLQGHDAELDVAAVDLLEDRGDRADRDVLDGRRRTWRPRPGGCSCTSAPGRRRGASSAATGSRSSARGRSAGACPAGAGPRWRPGRGRCTSSSRADDQMSSPSACLTWPIRRAISARRFRSPTSSWSSLSIWPRRLARVGAARGGRATTRTAMRGREWDGRRRACSASVDSGRDSRCSGPIGSDVKRSAISGYKKPSCLSSDFLPPRRPAPFPSDPGFVKLMGILESGGVARRHSGSTANQAVAFGRHS